MVIPRPPACLFKVNFLYAQVGTAILLIGDPEKVTTVTDESVVEATASAPAANVPPGRDSECRRRRMPVNFTGLVEFIL